jgi:recombination protein RecT
MTQKKEVQAKQPDNGMKSLVKSANENFEKLLKDSGASLSWTHESMHVLFALNKNPSLRKCSKESIKEAIYNLATVGLTLNPALGYCYLIPRKGEAVLDISYKGFIKIATDEFNISNIHTGIVHSNDFFDLKIKDEGICFEHKPVVFGEKGEAIGSYAVAWTRDTNKAIIETMDMKELEKIKNSSQAAGTSFSPWNGDFSDQMRRKSPLRRLFNMLPKSGNQYRIAEAFRIDNENFDADFKNAKPREEKKPKSFDDFIEVEEQEIEEN